MPHSASEGETVRRRKKKGQIKKMPLTSKLFIIFLLAFANTQVTPLSNTAESSSAASSVSLTGPIWLTQQQIDDWMALKGDMDAHVPNGFNDCNSEIDDAYVQAVAQYSSGLSDNVSSFWVNSIWISYE